MIRFSFLALCLSLLASSFFVQAAYGGASSFTFFQGTQYPLAVHFLRGREAGPTVMVQGGIQGDEPSGYLCAQLLTKSQVHKGSLIVVPRANTPSIHQISRQVNVDLNRRFDKDYNQFYEDRLARAIRFLLAGSDAFIHLHEGSGFYHPTYVDGLRNPRRYGQSIIIDTTVFQNRIDLARTANAVLHNLNPTIVPADYRFQLFNTNTFAADTAHPEQRKSLTYYALAGRGIPALAIEVSKDIRTLAWKVQQQLRATVLLLRQLGVDLSPPYLQNMDMEEYIAKQVSLGMDGQHLPTTDNSPLEVESCTPMKPLLEPMGEEKMLEPVWAVYASDRPDMDMLQTPRMPVSPFEHLVVKADGRTVRKVPVKWSGGWPGTPAKGKILFACSVNGRLRFVPEGNVLDVVEGDQVVLEGIWGGGSGEVLNLKGYVSAPGRNDGQDMGHEIVMDSSTFIARYFLPGSNEAEKISRVVRETPGAKKAEFHIRIVPRRVDALKLRSRDGETVFVAWRPDGEILLPPGEYFLEEALGNGSFDKLLATSGLMPIPWKQGLTLRLGERRPITLRQATTFAPLGSMVLAAPNS